MPDFGATIDSHLYLSQIRYPTKMFSMKNHNKEAVMHMFTCYGYVSSFSKPDCLFVGHDGIECGVDVS